MDELKDLIEKAKNGSRDAFGSIYKIYYKKIYRYCMFNTENEDIAQDICQETFVKAWRSIKKFNVKKDNWSIQAFLFKIARNLIIDFSRKKKSKSLGDFNNYESDEDLYEKISKNQNSEKVQFAIKKLEETERQIVILRYFEEMDTKEIAEILGVKDGAIRVRIHRTLQKLKSIIEIYDRRTN